MKNIKKYIALFIATSACSISGVFAAGIDHFEVHFSPDTARAGEALDLTIEAVDKNNITILDYDSTILIFSETDGNAELPSALSDSTYTFLPSDQGKIKFENSVKFSEAGLQNIYIYDLNDDTVFGVAEATIEKEEEVTLENELEISIISPEDGLVVGTDSVNISGSTNKNFQVKIIHNGENEYSAISNDEGIFEKTVENLTVGDNTLKAQILNSEGKVIGESEPINVKYEKDVLSIRSINFTPKVIYQENSFKIDIVTNPGLNEVSIILNDVITMLKETEESGVYTAKVFAPKEAGNYKIDANLVDELGHKKTEMGAASLTVNELELEAAPEEEVVETPVVVIEPAEPQITSEDLMITGIKLVELKSKSILTWDALEKAESYNVYKKLENGDLELIQNVKEARFEVEIEGEEIKYDYFAIKAVANVLEGETFEGNLSDATKVKTGPELIILFLISILLGGMVFAFKNKNS